jgi:hypothetical protein
MVRTAGSSGPYQSTTCLSLPFSGSTRTPLAWFTSSPTCVSSSLSRSLMPRAFLNSSLCSSGASTLPWCAMYPDFSWLTYFFHNDGSRSSGYWKTLLRVTRRTMWPKGESRIKSGAMALTGWWYHHVSMCWRGIKKRYRREIYVYKGAINSFNSVFNMMSDIILIPHCIVPIIIHPNRSSPTDSPTTNLKNASKYLRIIHRQGRLSVLFRSIWGSWCAKI